MIGLLETHGRADTAALADGLGWCRAGASRTAARRWRRWTSRRSSRARPELCLIDELAHTNAPGLEHHKRYEDIEDVLDAGIDVFSTMNVQHLESLNDSVAELPACACARRARRRARSAPTRSSSSTSRPRRCSIACAPATSTRAERIEAALNNFFKVENLAALREIALRQVAEDVEAAPDAGRRHARGSVDARAAGRGRAAARAGRAVARARSGSSAGRGARRSGSAPSSTCSGWSRPGSADEEQARAGRAARARLGARRAAARRGGRRRRRGRRAWRRERGTTYVLLGESRAARGLARLREPLPQRLMRPAPGVDVRIVADRARRR